MSSANELLQKARASHAAGRDLDARLALAAAITELARPSGVRPIVVGGTAVDFYAAKTTPTGLRPSIAIRGSLDLDIITVGTHGPDAPALRRALAASTEFYSEDNGIPILSRRKWWLHGAPLLVEVLGGELFGDPDRVVELVVDQGEAFLWAPEDTAWQYMQTAWSERNRMCWERALAIAVAQADDWDWDYLRTRPDPLAPVALVDALQASDGFDDMVERLAG